MNLPVSKIGLRVLHFNITPQLPPFLPPSLFTLTNLTPLNFQSPSSLTPKPFLTLTTPHLFTLLQPPSPSQTELLPHFHNTLPFNNPLSLHQNLAAHRSPVPLQ